MLPHYRLLQRPISGIRHPHGRLIRCQYKCLGTARRRNAKHPCLTGRRCGKRAISLDAYVLCGVPILSTVAPVERYVFTNRLECKVLTNNQPVFPHEDYLLTRQSSSDAVFCKYTDTRCISALGIIVYIKTYPSAPKMITTAGSK